MGLKLEYNDFPNYGPEYSFYCPGCECYHWFKTKGGSPVWAFNGDMEKPTVVPSIWVNKNSETNCHLHITNGQIIYTADSYHQFKGQTIDMVDAED